MSERGLTEARPSALERGPSAVCPRKRTKRGSAFAASLRHENVLEEAPTPQRFAASLRHENALAEAPTPQRLESEDFRSNTEKGLGLPTLFSMREDNACALAEAATSQRPGKRQIFEVKKAADKERQGLPPTPFWNVNASGVPKAAHKEKSRGRPKGYTNLEIRKREVKEMDPDGKKRAERKNHFFDAAYHGKKRLIATMPNARSMQRIPTTHEIAKKKKEHEIKGWTSRETGKKEDAMYACVERLLQEEEETSEVETKITCAS